MILNNVTSELKILGTSVKKLDVKNTIVSFSDDMEKKIGLDIKQCHTVKEESGFYSELIIEIEVSLEDEIDKVCDIKFEMEGAFESIGSMSKEDFEQLVMINGAAALYSIARSKIEIISGLIFQQGKLILPFINIFDYYREGGNEF